MGGFLHKDIETYGNLSLTEQGKKFLQEAVVHHLREGARLQRREEAADDEPVRGGRGAAAMSA